MKRSREQVEARINRSLLLDFYGPLLTERQQYCMIEHFEKDMSLGEIAEELGISRQAVHDNLQRATQILETYEEKLHLVAHYEERKQLIQSLKEKLAMQNIKNKEIDLILESL